MTSWENDIGYDSGHNMFAYGEAGYWSMLSDGRGAKHANDTSQGDLLAVTKAVHFMQHDPPEPFVLFLATRGAHPPYGAPPEYTHKWTLDQVKQHVKLRPPNDPRKPRYHQPDVGIQHYRNLTELGESTFYEIQRTYLEMVSFTDWTFGQLLAGLEAANGGTLAANTAVFHSSDHGDFAGDYRLVEKWPGAADDVLTHVPMAARIPGGLPHNVAKGPVQSMDMMETMLELAGIESDWVRFGRSLAPLMREGTADGADDLTRMVYAEGGFYYRSELFPGGSDHVPDDPHGMYWPRAQEEMSGNGTGSPKWVMVRNLTHKLVYRPTGVSELYDLTADPRELDNVYGESQYAQVRQELVDHLTAWLIRTGDVPPLRNDPRGPPKNPNPIDAETCASLLQPDPSRVQQLREEAAASDLMSINGIPNFSL